MQHSFWKNFTPFDILEALVFSDDQFRLGTEVLLQTIPNLDIWRYDDSTVQLPQGEISPLAVMLLSIATGDFFARSCYIKRETDIRYVDPQKIYLTFLIGNSFMDFLLRKPPLDGTVIVWDCINKGRDRLYETELGKEQRLISFLINTVQWPSNSGNNHNYSNSETTAICFNRRDRIDVFPFPFNWRELADDARQKLIHMDQNELIKIDMIPSIERYVELFGRELVQQALNSVRK